MSSKQNQMFQLQSGNNDIHLLNAKPTASGETGISETNCQRSSYSIVRNGLDDTDDYDSQKEILITPSNLKDNSGTIISTPYNTMSDELKVNCTGGAFASINTSPNGLANGFRDITRMSDMTLSHETDVIKSEFLASLSTNSIDTTSANTAADLQQRSLASVDNGQFTLKNNAGKYHDYNDDEEEEEEDEDCDPQSYELKIGYRILKEFLIEANKSLTWPFLNAVDAKQDGAADYYEKVPYPMWLNKMKEKFYQKDYTTISEYVSDFRLMLENCYRYNGPDHPISKKAQRLETMLEQKLSLLSRELREKTSIAASVGTDLEIKRITGSRRRKVLVPHDSTALLNQLRLEKVKRQKESRKLQIADRKLQLEEALKEVDNWEEELMQGDVTKSMKSMWEIPQIGHFLFLCQGPLNIGEVMHFELERCFAMPRESSVMQRVMTTLLSTPYQRTRLHLKPFMPYKVWEDKLRIRVRQWYKAFKDSGMDIAKTSQKLGLEEKLFKVVGLKNPLEKKKYHELSFYQRVWLMKGLCDFCLENQESLRESIELQPETEQRDYVLGSDACGNSYLHFPQFCGADVRIYRQSPIQMPVIELPTCEILEMGSKKKRSKQKGGVSSRRRHTRFRQHRGRTQSNAELAEENDESTQDLNSSTSSISSPGRFSRSENESPLPNIWSSGRITRSALKRGIADKGIDSVCDNHVTDRSPIQTASMSGRSSRSATRAHKTAMKGSARREQCNKPVLDANNVKDCCKKISFDSTHDNEDDASNTSGKAWEVKIEDKTKVQAGKYDIGSSDCDWLDKKKTCIAGKVEFGSTIAQDNKLNCDARANGASDKGICDQTFVKCSPKLPVKDTSVDMDSVETSEGSADIAVDSLKNSSQNVYIKEENCTSLEKTKAKQTTNSDVCDRIPFIKDNSDNGLSDDILITKKNDNETTPKDSSYFKPEDKVKKDNNLTADVKEETNHEIIHEDLVVKTEVKEENSSQLKQHDEKEMGPVEAEEADQEPEILGPDEEEFELVVENIDGLRKLAEQFDDPDPDQVITNTAKRVKTTAVVRKRCERDLYSRLVFLLKELEPWENKLHAANRKAKLKLKREHETYEEEPEQIEDVWESDTEQLSEGDCESSDYDSKTSTASLQTKLMTKPGFRYDRKKGTPLVGLNEDSQDAYMVHTEEYGISLKGRKRKRRVIPNNVEDQSLQSKKAKAIKKCIIDTSPITTVVNVLTTSKSSSNPSFRDATVTSSQSISSPPLLNHLSFSCVTASGKLTSPGEVSEKQTVILKANPDLSQKNRYIQISSNLGVKNYSLLNQIIGGQTKPLNEKSSLARSSFEPFQFKSVVENQAAELTNFQKKHLINENLRKIQLIQPTQVFQKQHFSPAENKIPKLQINPNIQIINHNPETNIRNTVQGLSAIPCSTNAVTVAPSNMMSSPQKVVHVMSGGILRPVPLSQLPPQLLAQITKLQNKNIEESKLAHRVTVAVSPGMSTSLQVAMAPTVTVSPGMSTSLQQVAMAPTLAVSPGMSTSLQQVAMAPTLAVSPGMSTSLQQVAMAPTLALSPRVSTRLQQVAMAPTVALSPGVSTSLQHVAMAPTVALSPGVPSSLQHVAMAPTVALSPGVSTSLQQVAMAPTVALSPGMSTSLQQVAMAQTRSDQKLVNSPNTGYNKFAVGSGNKLPSNIRSDSIQDVTQKPLVHIQLASADQHKGLFMTCPVSQGKVRYESNIKVKDLLKKQDSLNPKQYYNVGVNNTLVDRSDKFQEYLKGEQARKEKREANLEDMVKNSPIIFPGYQSSKNVTTGINCYSDPSLSSGNVHDTSTLKSNQSHHQGKNVAKIAVLTKNSNVTKQIAVIDASQLQQMIIKKQAIDHAIKQIITEPPPTSLPTANIKVASSFNLPRNQPYKPCTILTSALKHPISSVKSIHAETNRNISSKTQVESNTMTILKPHQLAQNTLCSLQGDIKMFNPSRTTENTIAMVPHKSTGYDISMQAGTAVTATKDHITINNSGSCDYRHGVVHSKPETREKLLSSTQAIVRGSPQGIVLSPDSLHRNKRSGLILVRDTVNKQGQQQAFQVVKQIQFPIQGSTITLPQPSEHGSSSNSFHSSNIPMSSVKISDCIKISTNDSTTVGASSSVITNSTAITPGVFTTVQSASSQLLPMIYPTLATQPAASYCQPQQVLQGNFPLLVAAVPSLQNPQGVVLQPQLQHQPRFMFFNVNGQVVNQPVVLPNHIGENVQNIAALGGIQVVSSQPSSSSNR